MYKQIILCKLFDYLKLKKYPMKKCGTVINVDCPFCKEKESVHIVYPIKDRGKCLKCNKEFSIIDIARILESTLSDKTSEEEVLHYLKEFLDVKVLTKTDQENIKNMLEKYQKWDFDLVPIVPNGKIPNEKDWTKKSHKDVNEWYRWVKDGYNIGVKTGAISKITVIDIDQKPIPEEIKKIMGKPLIQESTNGYHLIYKYAPELRKTRIDKLKMDIENDGGQVVIYPSLVKDIRRKFIEIPTAIPLMPEELKNFLKTEIGVPRKTFSEKVAEDIQTEDFNLGILGEGQRNSTLVRLGGIFRKELNMNQTNYVLNMLNKYLCKIPLPPKEITAMVNSLDRYNEFDEKELAHKVLEYLKDVEEANRTEIAMAVVGTNRGEDKKRVDKALKFLVKEEYITKRGRSYSVMQKVEWETSLVNIGIPVDFKVPYFHDIANFNWGDMILIGSGNKKGKCYKKGTGILMEDGSIKKVEQIIPGDKVMGVDSTPRKVLDIAGGKEMMYEIKPCRGESFTVNESHILSLKKVGTGQIINISVKDFLNKSKKFQYTHYLYRVPVEFDKKEVSIAPYYLGLWLGDGDKTNPRITTKDKEIISYLNQYAKDCKQKLIEYNYPNRCTSYAITHGKQGYPINTILIDSLHKQLRKNGVLNNKHIPFNYKTNCRQYRLELLAGLIDSDGYLKGEKTAYEICITNKRLANDIVYLARSLGFFAYIRTRTVTATNWNYSTTAYRISICGNVTQIPIKIQRKKALARDSKRNPLVTKFTVKKLKIDYYYGFTLDGDHLHLLDNFIVNHNTHISINIVKQLVEQGITPYYISLEPGSRFAKIALQLGLKEGDFKHKFIADPTKIPLEPNSVTIIDWLMITDKAKTDLVFYELALKLQKTNGFLIIFQQLKEDGNYFAPNMCKQFPALACRYFYDNKDVGEYGKFQIDEVREAKLKIKTYQVPCQYDWETKELKRVDEIKENTDLTKEEENENGED